MTTVDELFAKAIALAEEERPTDVYRLGDQVRLRPSELLNIALDLAENPPPPPGKKIDLSKCFLGVDRCLLLGRRLILNQTITYLDISYCDMGFAAAVEFFHCLSLNSSIRHVNVSGNYIGDAGCAAACTCIDRLESLHMASNEITDKGAITICRSIVKSSSIKILNLRNNFLTLEGICFLIGSLDSLENIYPEDVRSNLGMNHFQLPAEVAADENTTSEIVITEPATEEADPESASGPQSPKDENVEKKEEKGKEENKENNEEDDKIGDEEKEEGEMQEGKEELEEKPEMKFNETLEALWIEYNITLPDDIVKYLNVLLAQRCAIAKAKIPTRKKGKKKSKKK